MRATIYSVFAAIGVFLAAGAGEVAAGYSMWQSVGDFGLPVTFAVAAFVGMLLWIKQRMKETREDQKESTRRMEAMELFQRESLLKQLLASNATMDHITGATDRATAATVHSTAAIQALTQMIDLMRLRFNFRPCMALESLPDADRRHILEIFEERLNCPILDPAAEPPGLGGGHAK